MNKLGTVCNDCIFFEEGNCQINILQAFESIGTKVHREDDKVVIERVCPYRRDMEWVNSIKENESPLEKLIDEVHIKGTVVLFCNDLETAKEKIKIVDGIPNIDKFNLVFVHFENVAANDLYHYCRDNVQHKYKIMQIFSHNFVDDEVVDFKGIADEAFKRAKNGYMFFLESQKDIDTKCIEKINKVVNTYMLRLLYVPPVSDYHGMVVMTPLYKVLKGNKITEIENKIKVMAEEAKTETGIINWNQINENINCS